MLSTDFVNLQRANNAAAPVERNLGDATADARRLPLSPPARPGNPELLDDESSFVTCYNRDFQTAFETGTSIAWTILFSPEVGGNFDPTSDDHIYVTAWNRAAFGCEALVAYMYDTKPCFAIFDHKTGAFTVRGGQPMSDFSNYVTQATVNGVDLLALSVINMTYRASGSSWKNEVYVVNGDASNCVYASPEYSSSQALQAGFNFDGAYGPTVEPSRGPLAPFKGINTVGWTSARVANRNAAGQWEAWQDLVPANSSVRAGIGGFGAVYQVPNSAALVNSAAAVTI